MGQFASKAFDGDPYIEIMRVLPDKELCWWIQKVIWVAEGFTLVEHFGRTYPQLFIYKCEACNGAGTVTCPHCNGYKVKRASSYNGFRLSEQTTVGRLLATAGTQECDHCGGYCQWDAESEWQGMWEDWERKLAYYDRSFGKVMDNWYEDVVNEGNLDQDTPQPEEPAPGPEDTSIMAQLDRDVEKMPMRTKALMQRFGGHPYENFDMIPYQILDPTKPLEENVDRMGMDYNWLPPELDPQGFPEYLLQANNPIAQFEHQIRMEYLILNNLDAAIKDQPKPAQFGPSAGTVLCPDCLGKPHGWSFAPNVSKLFRAEPPFWLRTLARMDALGTSDVSASSYRQSRSLTGSSADQGAGSQQQDAASSSNGRGGRKRFGEVPHQPYKDIEIQAALESSGNLWHYNPRSRSVQGETSDQEYGPMDPLSYAPQSTLKNPEQELGHVMGKANPITGKAAAEAHRIYHNLNPAKNLARKIRDVQQLRKASTPEEMEAAMDWLRTRESVAGDL